MTAVKTPSLSEVTNFNVSVLGQFGVDISDLATQLTDMTNHDYLYGINVRIDS